VTTCQAREDAQIKLSRSSIGCRRRGQSRRIEGLLETDSKEAGVGQADIPEKWSSCRKARKAGWPRHDGRFTRRGACGVLRRKGLCSNEGSHGSLKPFQDDAKEVPKPATNGLLTLETFQDYQIGDVIEDYTSNKKVAALRCKSVCKHQRGGCRPGMHAGRKSRPLRLLKLSPYRTWYPNWSKQQILKYTA